jgi:hypothetical protein
MNNQHAHPSFRVLGTLVGMKRYGSTTNHNTPVRIWNLVSRNELYNHCFFYFNYVGVFWKMEGVGRTALSETCTFGLILNMECHLKIYT